MKHCIKKMTLLSLVLSLSQTIISAEGKTPKVSLLTSGLFKLLDLPRFEKEFKKQKDELINAIFTDKWKKPKSLKKYLDNITSLDQLEAYYNQIKKKQNFDHIKCAWALKEVYTIIECLEYEQSKTLSMFIEQGIIKEKELEKFTFFTQQRERLVYTYPADFFNAEEPKETSESLYNLTLSPAEIAATWKMIK